VLYIAAPWPKKRLFFSASAAQQCHNVEFVHKDGPLEGGVAATAGRRVKGMHDNNTTEISNKFQT
jgi:hypothetical protein